MQFYRVFHGSFNLVYNSRENLKEITMLRQHLTAFVVWASCILFCAFVAAEKNDWAEGPGTSNGATRDYYNRAARRQPPSRLWVNSGRPGHIDSTPEAGAIADHSLLTRLLIPW